MQILDRHRANAASRRGVLAVTRLAAPIVAAMLAAPAFAESAAPTAAADAAAKANSRSGPAVTSCQVFAERYRTIAVAHRGESPLAALTTDAYFGIVGAPPLVEKAVDSKGLEAWAAQQKPRIRISRELKQALGSLLGTLEKLPNANFFSLTAVEGAGACYTSVYFEVANGVARLAPRPPGFEDEQTTWCGVQRAYALINEIPVYIQDAYPSQPGMTSSVTIATWSGGRFAGACAAEFSYIPLFQRKTGDSCVDRRCDEFLREAQEIVARWQEGGAGMLERRLAQLSPAQRAEFRDTAGLAGESGDASADGPGGKDSNPAGVSDGDPVLLPFVYRDRVYVASVGRVTMGSNYHSDWGVAFASREKGALVPGPSFTFSMSKGAVRNVSIRSVGMPSARMTH
jgi:hypothetical protein